MTDEDDAEREADVQRAIDAALGRKWARDGRARKFARKTLLGLLAAAPDGVDPAFYAFFKVLRALWFVRGRKKS